MPYGVCHLLGTSRIGGTERMVLAQIRRTAPELFRSSVGALDRGGPLIEAARVLGAETILLPGGTPAVALSVFRLTRWLRRHRIDVVHLYGLSANVIGRMAAHLAGVPAVIAAVRNTDDWRTWRHVTLDRATAVWVDRWISNSDAGRDRTIAREGVLPDGIVTVRNGVDVAHFAGRDHTARARLRDRLGGSPAATVALCVANARLHKGHYDLLAAMTLLADLNLDLWIIGEDHTRGDLGRTIASRGLGARVRLFGFQDDVVPYYSAADLLVHASWWEGTPNVVLEAMAMGLPVVATAVGDVPLIVEDGVTGVLAPPRAPAQLAGVLRRLVGHPDLAASMGRAGRRRAETEFSLARMVERIEATYLDVLTGRPGRVPEVAG